MQIHGRAKLGPAGRLALCQAIEGGFTFRQAAAAMSVSPAAAQRRSRVPLCRGEILRGGPQPPGRQLGRFVPFPRVLDEQIAGEAQRTLAVAVAVGRARCLPTCRTAAGLWPEHRCQCRCLLGLALHYLIERHRLLVDWQD
jgi:hypothetical protein